MAPEAAKRRKSGRRLGRRLGRALGCVLEGALQQPLIVLLGAALLFATTGTGVLGARHDSTPDSLSERGRALSRSKTAWPQVGLIKRTVWMGGHRGLMGHLCNE